MQMKQWIFILILLFSVTLTDCEEDTGPSGPVPEPEVFCKGVGFEYDYDSLTYNLVWSDEFDGEELDLDKWVYEVNSSGGGNNELQFYTDQNAVIEDGILQIIAKNEEYQNRSYTSSRITTQDLFEFRYGIVEIRSKQPAGRGTWSAHWMMPATSIYYGGWPNSGEIDIMEFVGYEGNRIHSTVHTEMFNHKKGTQRGGTEYLDTAASEFHVYKMEWLPDKIIFTVDDEHIFTHQPGKFVSCPEWEQWPFDREFFIILNVAIGGDWGGANGVDDSIFPTTMEVDYVRVYQADELMNIEQTPDE
jgi:beta-glucanase (GH16 family)